MPYTVHDEIRDLAAAIVYGNKGKAQFSIGEAAKIAAWNVNRFGADFAASGGLVKPSGEAGNGKMVSALALAEFMYKDRVSPLRGRKGT